MKKLFVLLVCLPVINLYGQTVKNVTLSFNNDDFTINIDNDGYASFSSPQYVVSYEYAQSYPAIPFTTVSIAVPSYQQYLGVSYTKQTAQWGLVNLYDAPRPVTANDVDEYTPTETYSLISYPASDVEYVGSNVYGDYNVLYFKVFPFEYNAATNQLTKVTNLNLSIQLSSPANGNNMTSILHYNNEWLKHFIYNSEEVNSAIDIPEDDNDITSLASSCKYLIITCDSLKDSFRELADWKTTKGVPTKIVTVEDIDASYTDATPQLRIKHCIKDYYDNYALEYVMLGGDDVIVPAQYCCCDKSQDASSVIDVPTDMFYACLNDLEWDGNHNSYPGEVFDHVNLYSNVALTRLPIRTAQHVTNYTTKLLSYEKNTLSLTRGNSMLLCGNIMGSMFEYSDVVHKSNSMYLHHIAPYWNGTVKHLFDTYTDFEGGANYDLNVSHLHAQLNADFEFFSMVSHGNVYHWKLENGGYRDTYVNRLNSLKPSVVTCLSSCHTSAFDSLNILSYDPCLGEAFIRSVKNGVVAYLGASREGYFSYSKEDDYSLMYEGTFYEMLFSNKLGFRNYGKLISYVKNGYIVWPTYDIHYRFINYGINPFGDAEMPIYVQTPIENYSNQRFYYSNGTLSMTPKLMGCDVCVMSKSDNGESYYVVKHDVDDTVYFPNVTDSVRVCITKDGYVPYVVDVDPLHISPWGTLTPSISSVSVNGMNLTVGLTIYIGDGLTVEIVDEFGQVKDTAQPQPGFGMRSYNAYLSVTSPGKYFVRLMNGNAFYDSKMVIVQ